MRQPHRSSSLAAGTDVMPGDQLRDGLDDLGAVIAATRARITAIVREGISRARALQVLAPHGSPELTLVTRQAAAAVHDCEVVLDQLQHTLTHQLQRRQQLDLAVFDVQATLAQARTEAAVAPHSELRARRLALQEGLSSLRNGLHFHEQLDRLLALSQSRGQPVAVFCLDLDGYKPVSLLNGHETRDEVLAIVSARLNRLMRAEDLTCRLGGDEFGCVVGGGLDLGQLGQLAHQVCEHVSEPLQVGAMDISVHPSIGISIYPQDGATALGLLQSADAALQQAHRENCRYAFASRPGDARPHTPVPVPVPA